MSLLLLWLAVPLPLRLAVPHRRERPISPADVQENDGTVPSVEQANPGSDSEPETEVSMVTTPDGFFPVDDASVLRDNAPINASDNEEANEASGKEESGSESDDDKPLVPVKTGAKTPIRS